MKFDKIHYLRKMGKLLEARMVIYPTYITARVYKQLRCNLSKTGSNKQMSMNRFNRTMEAFYNKLHFTSSVAWHTYTSPPCILKCYSKIPMHI